MIRGDFSTIASRAIDNVAAGRAGGAFATPGGTAAPATDPFTTPANGSQPPGAAGTEGAQQATSAAALAGQDAGSASGGGGVWTPEVMQLFAQLGLRNWQIQQLAKYVTTPEQVQQTLAFYREAQARGELPASPAPSSPPAAAGEPGWNKEIHQLYYDAGVNPLELDQLAISGGGGMTREQLLAQLEAYNKQVDSLIDKYSKAYPTAWERAQEHPRRKQAEWAMALAQAEATNGAAPTEYEAEMQAHGLKGMAMDWKTSVAQQMAWIGFPPYGFGVWLLGRDPLMDNMPINRFDMMSGGINLVIGGGAVYGMATRGWAAHRAADLAVKHASSNAFAGAVAKYGLFDRLAALVRGTPQNATVVAAVTDIGRKATDATVGTNALKWASKMAGEGGVLGGIKALAGKGTVGAGGLAGAAEGASTAAAHGVSATAGGFLKSNWKWMAVGAAAVIGGVILMNVLKGGGDKDADAAAQGAADGQPGTDAQDETGFGAPGSGQLPGTDAP